MHLDLRMYLEYLFFLFCFVLWRAEFPALVVKASGLAAGKGVIVANNQEEACKAVHEIMQVSWEPCTN